MVLVCSTYCLDPMAPTTLIHMNASHKITQDLGIFCFASPIIYVTTPVCTSLQMRRDTPGFVEVRRHSRLHSL